LNSQKKKKKKKKVLFARFLLLFFFFFPSLLNLPYTDAVPRPEEGHWDEPGRHAAGRGPAVGIPGRAGGVRSGGVPVRAGSRMGWGIGTPERSLRMLTIF
jgi:hypothetical protein